MTKIEVEMRQSKNHRDMVVTISYKLVLSFLPSNM